MAAQHQAAQVNSPTISFIRHLDFQFLPEISSPFPLRSFPLSFIRTEANSRSYFLGPAGTSDPREFIAAECKRIPFKAALTKPSQWQDAFKNWPLPPIAGWKNWYQRILADKSART
jgi:hypothetical protein